MLIAVKKCAIRFIEIVLFVEANKSNFGKAEQNIFKIVVYVYGPKSCLRFHFGSTYEAL